MAQDRYYNQDSELNDKGYDSEGCLPHFADNDEGADPEGYNEAPLNSAADAFQAPTAPPVTEGPAVEAVQLLGESNAPWVIVGRSLVQKLLRAAPEAGAWQLALCSRQWLFPMGAEQPLPAPLRSLALGLRALPPLDYVAENSWAPGAWCWHAPLWSNPLVACREVWDWFGQQHVQNR